MNERIQEKTREIKGILTTIETHLPDSIDEFTAMGLEKDGIYKNIETAIQDCYDICALIVKENHLRVPDQETRLPDLLVEKDILDNDIAEKLKDMKGFRNALARRYGNIDDTEAFNNIKTGLTDFHTFLEQIQDYMNR